MTANRPTTPIRASVLHHLMAVLFGTLALLPARAHAEATVGAAAPDWQLPWLDDGTAHLASFRGTPVLIDFWASWCVPCRLSMPALEALQRDYGDKVRILAISVDVEPAPAREFIARLAPGFRSLIDTEGAVAEKYALIGMPSSFIVDGDGAIQYIHEGYRKGDDQAWREALDALLAGHSGQ